MEMPAFIEIGAAETLSGTPIGWNDILGPRTEGQFTDRYPASVDGRPVLIYAGRIYTAGEWDAVLSSCDRRLTVGRISAADAEAIRDAGWTITEAFAAEECEVRPHDLVERRRRLGMTQAELGQLIGTSANTVACWERGDKRIGNPRMLDLALRALEQEESSQETPREQH